MATDSDSGCATEKMKNIAAELRRLHEEYESKLQPAFINTLHYQQNIQKSEEFCEKQVRHLLHNLEPLRARISSLKPQLTHCTADGSDEPLNELCQRADELVTAIKLIKRNLPAPSGFYLYFVLGSIRVSMPNNKLKLNYKLEYENFKLVVTWALMILSVICLCRGAGTRWDPVLMFGLVWFYCTLTIRESILRANGSNINGWWRLYHFLATILSGVTILWADQPDFQQHLRFWFLIYTLIVLLGHQMQYRYQTGTIYRLKALGDETGNQMEVSTEGIKQSIATPMLRDFFILLPFLYAVYLLQLLMVYLILNLIVSQPDITTWHSGASAVLYGLMFFGNVVHTSFAIYSKCTSILPEPMYFIRKFQ